MAGFHYKAVFAAALVVAAALFALPAFAYASDVEQLGIAYTTALRGYEDALAEREQNADEIAALDEDIKAVQASIDSVQAELDETAAALFKETRSTKPLIDMLLKSKSFQDAVMRLDTYEKVIDSCRDRITELSDERAGLEDQLSGLEAQKNAIESKVTDAKKAADDAQAALLEATRVYGAEFHQRQGNNKNCGATAFIVGVNILLHGNRFTDNVKVWEGPGFEGDSTSDLAQRGRVWLEANGLSDKIGIEDVPGDVNQASKMKELLEAGNMVVISSGPDSTWQLANGKQAKPGSHKDGHWVVFYRYEGGVFFCNDSSAAADKGAGCPYTDEQMQQWLDGRSYHFATIIYKKK